MSVNVRELTNKCEMETCIYSKSEYYNYRTTIANSLRSQHRVTDIPYPRFLNPQYPISQIFYPPKLSHIPDFTVNFPYPRFYEMLMCMYTCSSFILVILSFRNNILFQYDRLFTCALGTIFSVNWTQILRATRISQ